MKRKIEKVAVIGAGLMGSAIAAHITNANIPVYLLDIPSTGSGSRNALAERAIERMLKTEPAPFMNPKNASLITPGNIEDDLEKLKDCDWIIEAIVEKVEIKKNLYQRLEGVISPSTLVSSNTSTIPLHMLIEGRSEQFQKNFLITHFFNPPRYMRLLEIVRGPKTSEETYEAIQNFADIQLGKSIVDCKDTPGFIANRIGTFWVQSAFLEAIDRDLMVEEADAIFSKPMGIPKTGVFGLLDVIGIDLMPLIGKSLIGSLPPEDLYCLLFREPEIITKMIADGYTGRKGKGGFYRLVMEGDQRIKESINLQTGEYGLSQKPQLASITAGKQGLKALLTYPDKGGEYAWSVLSQVLSYAASLVPEISDSIEAIDRAMRLGFNWKQGPFELMDRLGPSWIVERLRQQGREIPHLLEKVGDKTFYRVEEGKLQYFTIKGDYHDVIRRPGHLFLSDIKLKSKPVESNKSASLWDIGDGVACLEFTTKMNSIDLDTMVMFRQSINIVQKDFKALVVYNEGTTFSAGANLGLALFAANLAMWPLIEQLLEEGQKTYKTIKYAPFPIVSAPSGMALGGGCELLLHSSAVQAHAESYIGLVETAVGVIPAWGGCKEMLSRWLTHSKRPGGTMVAIGKVFETIGMAKFSKSANEAKELLFLRPEDGITMNRDRLLADAKAKALSMANDYHAPQETIFSLPGGVARVALNLAVKGLVKIGKASEYDAYVSQKLADILSGGDTDLFEKVSEDSMSKLERTAFMELIQNQKTLERIQHMLETGKPLRN